MTSQRILDFFKTRQPEGPCLVVDLDVVAGNFKAFRHALPDSHIYYAVKANPAPESPAPPRWPRLQFRLRVCR